MYQQWNFFFHETDIRVTSNPIESESEEYGREANKYTDKSMSSSVERTKRISSKATGYKTLKRKTFDDQ